DALDLALILFGDEDADAEEQGGRGGQQTQHGEAPSVGLAQDPATCRDPPGSQFFFLAASGVTLITVATSLSSFFSVVTVTSPPVWGRSRPPTTSPRGFLPLPVVVILALSATGTTVSLPPALTVMVFLKISTSLSLPLSSSPSVPADMMANANT